MAANATTAVLETIVGTPAGHETPTRPAHWAAPARGRAGADAGSTRRDDERTLNGGTHPALVVATIVIVLGDCAALAVVLDKGSWLYQFLFQRGFVQWVTLSVFAFGLAALVQRFVVHLRESLAFGQVRRGITEGLRPSAVLRRLSRFRSHVLHCPDDDPQQAARELAESDADEVEASYGVVGDVVQMLPLLGFFGTVLGLSRALYEQYVAGGGAGAGAKTFATAIGTAFDTTLLALACTLVTIIVHRLLRGRHEALLARLGHHVDGLVADVRRYRPARRPDATGAGAAVAALKDELATLCGEIAASARDQMAAACESATEQLAEQTAAAQRTAARAEEMATTVGERCAEHLRGMAVEAAGAVREEIAAAAAVATQGFRVEVAAAADRVLSQVVGQHEATARELAEGLRDAVAAADERSVAATEALVQPMRQAAEAIRQATTEQARQGGDAARAVSEALRQHLAPLHDMVASIAARNGHTADTVIAAIRDNVAALGQHVRSALSQPRRISFIERPLAGEETGHGPQTA